MCRVEIWDGLGGERVWEEWKGVRERERERGRKGVG